MSEFEITPPEQTARKLTTEERRIERIRKLKNRMQRETNLLATQTRRTRNSQLISWGIMVEAAFRKGTAEKRQEFRDMARNCITDERNFSRISAGFDRVTREEAEAEAIQKESSAHV